jgi:hypothetical protein
MFKELYGAGILFFYYFKYPILIGWPILRFYLQYNDNIYLDILWIYCLVLMLKDIIYKFILKKDYCDQNMCGGLKNDKL